MKDKYSGSLGVVRVQGAFSVPLARIGVGGMAILIA